ncbi:MAG TPA: hypothetical protein VNJ12_02360 [Candidatus Dormibacteraeota bacterium]|nr:hypothetical protein [Candidatus Dormibacteraeota bacterium]
MKGRERKGLNRTAMHGESTTSPLGRRGKDRGPTGAAGTATQWLIWQIGQAASAAADLWMWKILPMTDAPISAHAKRTASVAIREPLRAGFHASAMKDIYTI